MATPSCARWYSGRSGSQAILAHRGEDADDSRVDALSDHDRYGAGGDRRESGDVVGAGHVDAHVRCADFAWAALAAADEHIGARELVASGVQRLLAGLVRDVGGGAAWDGSVSAVGVVAC